MKPKKIIAKSKNCGQINDGRITLAIRKDLEKSWSTFRRMKFEVDGVEMTAQDYVRKTIEDLAEAAKQSA